MMLGMCGVCKKEIRYRVQKSQKSIQCPKCGEVHYIDAKEGSITTAHCGHLTMIYEEGGGYYHIHENNEKKG